MTEPEKAKRWRVARSLSVAQLAEISGYSPEAIYAFEKGIARTKGNDRIAPWAWQRYKNVCAGLDAQIRSGINFQWGE